MSNAKHTYSHDVHKLFEYLGQLAYDFDALQAKHEKSLRQAEKTNRDSVQNGPAIDLRASLANDRAAANSAATTAPSMPLKIEIPLHGISYDLGALDAMREQRGIKQPVYHAISRARMLWVRQPRSNSWGIEMRTWRSLTLDEQHRTRNQLGAMR